MIHGMTNNNTLYSLEDSEWGFYLTGSRFFGNSKINSDWDLFVEVPKDKENALEFFQFLYKNNFRVVSNYLQDSDHPDRIQELVMVYCNEKDNIHIQIVEDSGKKAKVQEWIKDHCKEFHLLPKKKHYIIWRFAYRLYNNYDEGI